MTGMEILCMMGWVAFVVAMIGTKRQQRRLAHARITARLHAVAEETAAEARVTLEHQCREFSADLDAERIASDGLRDQIAAHRAMLHSVLDGVDSAAAFFGPDRRLQVWTGSFEVGYCAEGEQLEVGMAFEMLVPIVAPLSPRHTVMASQSNTRSGDHSGTQPGDVLLDQADDDWADCLYHRRDGSMSQMRCRRISSGWAISLDLSIHERAAPIEPPAPVFRVVG